MQNRLVIEAIQKCGDDVIMSKLDLLPWELQEIKDGSVELMEWEIDELQELIERYHV